MLSETARDRLRFHQKVILSSYRGIRKKETFIKAAMIRGKQTRKELDNGHFGVESIANRLTAPPQEPPLRTQPPPRR